MDLVLKIIDNDPSLYIEAVRALDDTLKDMGIFANDVSAYIKQNIPSPPTPPEERERKLREEEEQEAQAVIEKERKRLEALREKDPKKWEKEEKQRLDKLQEADPEAFAKEMKAMAKSGVANPVAAAMAKASGIPGLSGLGPGAESPTRSRQGSLSVGGGERRGSGDLTARATVAMVTDDPEHKAAMKSLLGGAFADEGCEYCSFVYIFILQL